jgi:hypothetical protein
MSSQPSSGAARAVWHTGRHEVPMPFKSQAQRRKFAQLLVDGKISGQTFEEWNRETGKKKLPERLKRKASGRKKASAPRKKRAATKRRR